MGRSENAIRIEHCMNAIEVIRLVDERFDVVELLAELTELQVDAITAGHMSALMHLLAQKQEPIDRLQELSKQLQVAIASVESGALWQNDAQRDGCRVKSQLSEKRLAELLKREGECERLLQAQREDIGQQLLDVNNSHRAASRYSQTGETHCSGSSLDLSSDN